MSENEPSEIEDKPFQKYSAILWEKSRSPSRGGNTSAVHIHRIEIDGEIYSFFARGTKQFAYKGETVSFKYEIKKTNGKEYKNIIKQSFTSKDKKGVKHTRGDRSWKPTLRTAEQRLPASQREQRS